ncbi:hypothetical protein NEC53_004655 [Salmonella enterica]|nr:hypothetical protein [Salmonella enterica]EJH5557170.1 hypothetical protein [Salmonella enterica]
MTMETTMSSLDFWNNIISSSRKMANEPVSTYQNFFTKVMDELDLEEEDVEKHNSEKINNLGFRRVANFQQPCWNRHGVLHPELRPDDVGWYARK